MPDFDLADGYINLKANPEQFNEEMADLDKQIAEHHEARLQMQSSAGQAALKKAYELRQETEKTTRLAERYNNIFMFGQRMALGIEKQRFDLERRRFQILKDSVSFGESAARRIDRERQRFSSDKERYGYDTAVSMKAGRARATVRDIEFQQDAAKFGKAAAQQLKMEVLSFERDVSLHGKAGATYLAEERSRKREEQARFMRESMAFGKPAALRMASERAMFSSQADRYGIDTAQYLKKQRGIATGKDIDFNQNAAKFGEAVAVHIEKQRGVKEDRRNQRLVDAFRYGRVGGAAVGAGRSFSQAMGGIAPAAAVGAAGGALGIGLIQNVPILANTLSESFGLLSTVISKDLIRPVLELSKLLQDTARWWDQLGTGTKTFIVETVKLGAVMGGVALATGAVTKAFGLMLTGLTALAKHPLLLSITGVALGGVALEAGMRSTGNVLDSIGRGSDDVASMKRGELWDKGMYGAWAKRLLFSRHGGATLDNELSGIRGNQDRTMLGSIGPSSMGSLGDFYRKVMLDTTGKSELESRIKAVQYEAALATIELNRKTPDRAPQVQR